MKLFIALIKHSDWQIQDIFIDSIPWIKQHFSTVLVEGFPYQLNNQTLLDSLYQEILIRQIPLTFEGKDMRSELVQMVRQPP